MRVRAVLLAAALVVPPTAGTGPAWADILIAVAGPLSVTPLTGQYATFGEELVRGAELAVRDVNAGGGINGQKLTLLVADDACDPKLAVQVAEELTRQRIVFVDGHFCSGASIPASRVYHERGVLMIAPSSTHLRLTEQGFANVFRICGRDDRQGRFAANYAVDNGLADRIAIVQDQTTFGKGIADEFKKGLNERGVREAMDEAISQGDKEFGDLIARMRDGGIGLVYFGGYHTEASLFVRQARAQGLKATMMVNSAMLTREYWDLAGTAAEGTLMTFGPDPRKLPSAAEVVARFEAEGHEAEARTLYSYAAVQIFADAARKAGSTDLERLERELHADTFQTVVGPITFDAKGDNAHYEFRMYRWHDGSYEDICCGLGLP
jgi:branched-chain amino acid transport system substrate-binding protein